MHRVIRFAHWDAQKLRFFAPLMQTLGKMKTVTYFRLALVLPVAIPLALMPFGMNAFTGLLTLSLWFGGVQYAIFAAILFYWIGRLGKPESIKKLTYAAPLIFIPIQYIGWGIYSGEWDAFLVFSLFIILIGYAYVVIINSLYPLVVGNSE